MLLSFMLYFYDYRFIFFFVSFFAFKLHLTATINNAQVYILNKNISDIIFFLFLEC